MPAMTARTRWLIGGGLAVVAVVIVVGAAFLLGSRPAPEALRYVPANSVIVAELRLDLPGDQFQKVGNLLAHFPGFADQSTLATKLDETLDRLTGDATNGSVQYTTKLKPWLAGPTFAAILPTSTRPVATPLPSASDVVPIEIGGSRDGVVVATTDGKVTCDAVIQGGQPRQIAQGSMLVDTSGSMACFLDGKFGLLGTPAGIEAALAAHGAGSGMDRDPTYGKARDALGGDRIATVYASGSGIATLQQADASLPPSFGLGLPSGAALPEWLIAGVRAEDDAVVTDLLVAPSKPGIGSGAPAQANGSPLPTLPTLPPAHASDIAGFLPGNTVLLAEAHGVGVAAEAGLNALRADPEFQAQASQLDGALSLAGGAQGVVGWISDAGVVVIPSSAAGAGAAPTPAPSGATGGADITRDLDVGLVLVATDETTATAKVSQLTSLLSLAALSGNGTVTPEDVDGTTVTTIDLGDLSGLLGQAGAGGQLSGLPIPSAVHLKFSIAVRGKLVLIGGDDAFARAVLGVDAGNTLADQAAYKRSLDHAAASNLGQVYVAGESLRHLIDQLVPAEQQARWQADLRPYAAPIDAVVMTTTIENGIVHGRVVVTVSTPSPAPGQS